MFVWLLLWRRINKEAVGYASGKLHALLSELKTIRGSTLADLRSVIADVATYNQMKLPLIRTRDRVSRKGAPAESLYLDSLPVAELAKSRAVSGALASRLAANVDLLAARNALGIPAADWTRFLNDYSRTFLKYAVRRALEELQASSETLYGKEVIVAIADGEAYTLNGVANYHDMIKSYVVRDLANGREELRLAHRLWKKRNDAGYVYERHI